ncbi:hypothetical protein PsYK624_065000 [Phanerochaete sordida]|uniref:Malate dehydrogenase n=1 Tax=Phanerochaete sordida TaxID=48140 RepID=A0A9P3LD97_9APHY|nr:hypothetical protein PsYK624_065000 [Phanerochaete sordida]
MVAIVKLLAALSFFLVAQAFPAAEDFSLVSRSKLTTGPGSMCSTKKFDIVKLFPADLNGHGGPPIDSPVAKYPTFVTLSVGYQNYSCLDNGTWFGIGAVTQLFDISCIPQNTIQNFTTLVSKYWEAAGPGVSPQEVIDLAGASAFSMGIHYWIPSPLDPTNPLAINAIWDFRQQRMQTDVNVKRAWVLSAGDGKVPAPTNGTFDAPWNDSYRLSINGTEQGGLAAQIYRINSNDGNTPPGTCTPGIPQKQVKSTLNFWFYGGDWAHTIF